MPQVSKALRAGKSLEERKQLRKQQLIESGLELFGTRGYRSCSVKVVCDHAGLTERYFYESFSNREGLLVGVFDTLASDIDGRLRGIVEASDDSGEQRVRKLIDTFYHYVRDDERRGRIILSEILGVSPRVDRHYQTAVRNFASIIEDPALGLFADGKPHSRDARRVVSIGLVGAMLQIAIQWLLDDFRTPLGRVSNNTYALFRAWSER